MFGPPEVITGRLMSGAGAAPMLAASAEFTASAVAFEVAIDRLTAQLGYLTANWQGESAIAMQRSVLRFIVWLRVLQAQLITIATRTGSQAAAFTEAYATMAQMVEIVENRVTTAVLHATNFLGMNTIPIGVKEGQYEAMWARDVAVQTKYLADTVAFTSPEPIAPPLPITGLMSFPPVITQAISAALGAGDKVRLAAISAQSTASMLKGRLGLSVGLAGEMAARGKGGAEKAEAQAAGARHRESQVSDKADNQAVQQLVQQVPQQVAQVGQQVAQVGQQVLQPVQQLGQQVTQQFSSQISNLMSQVSPEHRLDNPGFFDTQPSSSTLDRAAGGGGAGALTAAMRVPSLAGLSGTSTGFRFPSGWDGAMSGAAAPPPQAPAGSGGLGGRGMGGLGGAPLHAMRRADDDEPGTIKRPDTELIPLWGDQADDVDTVSPGELVTERQETSR